MIEYRGSVIPLISLSQVLDVKLDFNEDEEAETEIVVIRKGDKLGALAVDEFIGQSEIVLKTLGKYLTNIEAISGATILGDGQVALIIDPNALIKYKEGFRMGEEIKGYRVWTWLTKNTGLKWKK